METSRTTCYSMTCQMRLTISTWPSSEMNVTMRATYISRKCTLVNLSLQDATDYEETVEATWARKIDRGTMKRIWTAAINDHRVTQNSRVSTALEWTVASMDIYFPVIPTGSNTILVCGSPCMVSTKLVNISIGLMSISSQKNKSMRFVLRTRSAKTHNPKALS